MYYSAIGVLAAMVLLIVNWDILRDPRVYEKPAWSVYRRFLFAVLAYYVTDILWGILEYKKLAAALFVDTTLYFLAMAAGIAFWAHYTVVYLNEKSPFGRFLVYAGRVIAGLISAVTALNIFKRVLFNVDSGSVYTALPLRYAVLVCQILFLTVISVFVLTSMFRSGSGSAGSVRYRIPASFGIIMAVCLFAQLWFPYLPLYSAAYMLGTCLLHSFVANDEKEEYKRQQSEAEKIAEIKDRFVSLLDNLPGMTFTKDAETGKYLSCNQAFAEYAERSSPEEVTGLDDAQLFDAETAAHFVKEDKIAASLSKPYIYYEEIPDKEGKIQQFHTTKIKFRDPGGRLCIFGICQDITDTVNIRHEQEMTIEAYKTAVKTGQLYTHIAQTLARDYTEMFNVNTDTEEFTEYRREENGSSLSEVRHGWHFFSDCKAELSESVYPDDKESFLSAMNRKKLMKALSRKDTFVMTYRRMIKNAPSYVSMKISRMEKDDRSIIIGFMDVDAEMREAMAKNEALSDALSSAEAANRSRTSFISGMSHEIRTPINAIIGIDSIALRNTSLSPETRSQFEKIGSSAKELLSIINNVIDMSRIESGRETLSKNEFSLSAMLEQLASEYREKCGKKGLEFGYSALNELGKTYIGDDKKLRDVLVNILSNAVKFTDAPGKVTMTAEKTREFDDRASVQFCIKDTGIGIDKDHLPKIFDGFSRGNSSRSCGGLGMEIAKRLVDMMNGTIGVESEKGAGTEFTVTVTLMKGDVQGNGYTGEIDPLSLYILVVDDNPIEAEHAAAVLEEVGIKADTCTSGQEALRKAEVQHTRKQPYSIILMDWNMPGMNGAETSAEIIRQYGNESVVAAMTAYNWDDIREEARCTGVENYMEKPLFASSILENLGRIARNSHLAVFKEKKRARLSGRRVLIAEDVELNAEILEDMLETENVKADHAANGKIALELFEKSTSGIYSAILMDVRMPVMDGLDAARAIRALDREDAKRIPIIALTGNAFDEDVQLSIQAGMNAHMNKPVEADRLIRILGELIYESEESITVI